MEPTCSYSEFYLAVGLFPKWPPTSHPLVGIRTGITHQTLQPLTSHCSLMCPLLLSLVCFSGVTSSVCRCELPFLSCNPGLREEALFATSLFWVVAPLFVLPVGLILASILPVSQGSTSFHLLSSHCCILVSRFQISERQFAAHYSAIFWKSQ